MGIKEGRGLRVSKANRAKLLMFLLEWSLTDKGVLFFEGWGAFLKNLGEFSIDLKGF